MAATTTREHEQANAAQDQVLAAADDQATPAPKTQFTSAGTIPPVDTTQQAAGPSASDRAYGAAETGSSSHSFTGPAHLRVTADGLNVRSSPSSAGRDNIVGGVHHGDHLEADGQREGDWLCVTFQGQRAFVHGRYVEVMPAKVAPEIAAQPEKAVEVAKQVEAAPAVQATAPAAAKQEAAPAAAPQEAAPAQHEAAPAAPPHEAAAPAAAHHEAAAAEAPAAHAAVPAAQAAHSDPALIRAEYQMLVATAQTGFMAPGTAVEMLIKFDLENNGGQMSATGLELIATMPFEIARAQVAEVNEKVPVKPGPDPTHEAAAAQAAAPVPDPATKHGAAPDPAAATPAMHSPDPKQAETHASAGGPAGVWAPPAGAQLSDAAIAQLGGQLHDPKADQVMLDLAGVMAVATEMKPHLYRKVEANGAQRENLVAGIHAVRAGLQSLGDGDARVEAFKLAINHKVEALSPYYAQINIMTIESAGGLSTCNVTSLAMSLSTVGKNADSYKESKRAQIVAVARHYAKDVAGAARANTGHDAAFASLRGLRLPDFMELAAIATNVHSADPSAAEIEKAAAFAVANKIDLSFLAQIAQDFGANTSLSYGTLGKAKTAALKKIGNANHFEADQLTDLRNAAEQDPSNTVARERYEKKKAESDGRINSKENEKDLPLEEYKAGVMATIKPLLDSGAGVISGTYLHFTHCYEMTEDHVSVQDPGQWKRADRKIQWDEARALEYFWNYLVVR